MKRLVVCWSGALRTPDTCIWMFLGLSALGLSALGLSALGFSALGPQPRCKRNRWWVNCSTVSSRVCCAGFCEVGQYGDGERGAAGALDPELVEELDCAPGNFIRGINIHICGAQGAERTHLRLLARNGGAQNFHELHPRIRYIVVRQRLSALGLYSCLLPGSSPECLSRAVRYMVVRNALGP